MMEDTQCLYSSDPAATTIVWPEENLLSLCRICANPNEYLIPIFTGEGVDHQLKMKIDRYLPINVADTDTIPTQVCYQCASTIIAWHDLFENCYEAEKKLYGFLNSGPKKDKGRDLSEKVLDDSLAMLSTESITSTSKKESTVETSKVLQPVKKRVWESHENPQAEKNTEKIEECHRTEVPRLKNRNLEENTEVTEETPNCKKKQKKRQKKEKISKCNICGKVFHFVEYLKSHLLSHSNNRPHLCHICGASFKRKDHVNHHRRTVHITHPDIIRELGEKGEEPLPCEVCGELKPTKHAMYIHKKKHNMKYTCDVCGKCFSLPSFLKTHMVQHHAEEALPCSICGEVQKSGHALYLHKKKHSTNYICDVCGKSFIQPSSLRTHMVIHSDETPYSCDECGKSFKLKVRLQLHKQSHGNLRPYACKICEDKRFKTKTALIVHNNMHNDTRPYPCPHCSFRARKNSDLVCHIRTHTGEKPYKCEVCGRGFAQAGDMRKHRSTHDRHKENVDSRE